MTFLNIRNVLWTLFALIKLAIVAASVSAEEMGPEYPRPLVASVMVNGCSGVVIQKGPKWSGILTARHCVIGNLGNKGPVEFIDGTKSEAILLAVSNPDDSQPPDLARFAVPTKDILGVCHLAIGIPNKARYEFIGFPAEKAGRQQIPYEDRCPYYYLMKPLPTPHAWTGWGFWGFSVDHGGAVPGCSGSGCYANGQLVSILSRNNGHNVATEAYGANPVQIAEFLRASDRNGCDKWNMGDWGEKAVNFEMAPAAISDKSNHKLFECKSGRCVLLPKDKPAPVPLPPPDAGHDEAPPPAESVAEKAPPSDVYSGHGKLPKRLKGIRTRAGLLDGVVHVAADHEQEIENLKAEVAELKAREPVQGPPVKDGADGQDYAPPPAAPKQNAIHAIVLGFLTILGVIGIDNLRRTRSAAQ